MAIIQQPDAISLSGNMKKFIVSSGNQVSFQLSDGAAVLLEATYEPGTDGRVTIDVKDIIESRLAYLLSYDNFYEQSSIVKYFTAVIDSTSVSFRVIRSGIAQLADTTSNWLTGNFLTWQPTTKPVTYYSPEWLTYYAQEACNIMLKATFPDNTVQNINLGACGAGKAFTCNLQYAVIAGLLGQRYPSYYDVWVETATGTRLTYVQRYLYSETKSELEQWFLFENSLGGLDTFRAYGDTDFTGNHDHKLSTADDVSSEYQIDTKRTYNKNTGYLDDYERRWLLDFFPSQKKYIYHQAAIRTIVVSESDVKYSASDLPSSYNFVYRFSDDAASALLNLIRDEDLIPEVITIPNLESPDFSLPPRLSEYPRVSLHGGVIIPAFDPNSSTPTVTTLAAIIAAAMGETIDNIPGSGTGGQLVNVLKTLDQSPATDDNVFSSLRVLLEILKNNEALNDVFLSKVNPDTATGLKKLLDGIEIGEFVAGMFAGKGAKIDTQGNIEALSLRLRALLEVPELRYNRLTIIGDEIILTPGGLIESVTHLTDRAYQINMVLQDGEAITHTAGALIKGIFNSGATGVVGTSYMIVEEVGQTFMKINLALDADVPTGINIPPQPFMNIARVGHVADPDQQRYMVFSTKLGGYQLYDGCSNFLNGQIAASFDTAQSFKSLFGELPLKEGLPYLYAAGLVVQDIIRVDYQGLPVREVYDRGPWQTGVTYYNNEANGTDDVWHLGCRWRCFSSSTSEEPTWSSAAWYMIEGRSDARMEFDSSHGFAFFAGNVDTVITPVVIIGNTNVSAAIIEEQWSWTRESEDQTADTIWNIQKGTGRILHITNNDMGTSWSRTNPVRFICTATYPASSINNITSYIEV